MTASIRPIGNEVFAVDDTIVQLGQAEVQFLKRRAETSSRRRARICAHRNSGDLCQEMLIAICRDSYVRPHKHRNKSESFHVVEGSVDVVLLNDEGVLTDVIVLGDAGSGRPFYYRLADDLYHTLIVRSSILVMHEVTSGPFEAGAGVFAPFAPAGDTPDEAASYMIELERRTSSRI